LLLRTRDLFASSRAAAQHAVANAHGCGHHLGPSFETTLARAFASEPGLHMETISAFIEAINNLLWHNVVLFILVFTGLLFTFWTKFGQYRALTHGVKVIRGVYDDKADPGAINHFQALSTALSATVGLGNIAGVAVAVALGGPGAILWMWVIGIVGMSLKMTEVIQSMLYRRTEDPENPNGGPMYVARDGFRRMGFPRLGSAIGGLFVVTLIISAITGGNMFQAWNVANITENYFHVPTIATGIILAILVGMVIIGGIKWIGRVAGTIVPIMCTLYLLAALYVLFNNIGQLPAMLGMIVSMGLPEWLGGSAAAPENAFLGGTFGYAALWGVKRALFSSEAGQGSAPIAHAAAKTDEPVREGVVAGLEPFIDTIVVCTLTALVILSTGAYNREPEAAFADAGQVQVVQAMDEAGRPIPDTWTLSTPPLPPKTEHARHVQNIYGDEDWRPAETVFVIVHGEQSADTGRDLRRIQGTVTTRTPEGNWQVRWGTLTSTVRPTLNTLPDGRPDLGVYGDYAGATLTGHAFDRVTPGLGKYLVTLACWLFAVSTMISWSYYGEQGVVYLFGRTLGGGPVLLYKLIYCLLIILTCVPGFISTDAQLDMWTTLGTGVMLVVNIPLMLIFGSQAMKAYHSYIDRLKRGEMIAHAEPPMTEVLSGHDVE
jgi:alanine or glycine:cation symporter, AGCS family